MPDPKIEQPDRDETTLHEVVDRIREGTFYEDYDWASGPALRALGAALLATPAQQQESGEGVELVEGLVLPGQVPPFLSAPTFNDREEERVCINGCLYLRADFMHKLFAERTQSIRAQDLEEAQPAQPVEPAAGEVIGVADDLVVGCVKLIREAAMDNAVCDWAFSETLVNMISASITSSVLARAAANAIEISNQTILDARMGNIDNDLRSVGCALEEEFAKIRLTHSPAPSATIERLEGEVEREAQYQWDLARWKLQMQPSLLPVHRTDFRNIARATLSTKDADHG